MIKSEDYKSGQWGKKMARKKTPRSCEATYSGDGAKFTEYMATIFSECDLSISLALFIVRIGDKPISQYLFNLSLTE